MDKELLRSVIIATGLLIIIGMLIVSYIKNLKARKEAEFDDDINLANFPKPAKSKTSEPVIPAYLKEFELEPEAEAESTPDESERLITDPIDEDLEPPARMPTPALIQFSLVANSAEGFNGLDIQNAFSIVGLVYGSLKIYERLDANRLVDYGVACMQEPGTFPDNDLELFYCPGLVFFMQPGVLDHAQEIFDDFIETMQILAIELDGKIMDHIKQPLKDTTIQEIRASL